MVGDFSEISKMVGERSPMTPTVVQPLLICNIATDDTKEPSSNRRAGLQVLAYLPETITIIIFLIILTITIILIHSFIADIYLAPLQVGLLRSAPSPSTAE